MEPQPPEIAPQPAPPLVPPKPKNNNFLIILLSVLLLLATSLAFFFALQTQKLSRELSKYQTQVSPTPVATLNPTANWKTFTFEPIGHTFKYPTDWTAAQCEGGIHLFTQPTQRSGTSCETPPFGVVFIAFDNKPIETGYLKSTDYILEKEQNITLPSGQATKRVIKQINEAPGPTNYLEITFKGTNEYYYLISTEDSQYEIVVDQILSTFRFID